MEVWKDIKDTYGKYLVSNYGSVVMMYKDIPVPVNHFQGKNGYQTVKIILNKETSTRSVHRLVAEAFLPNPHNKPCINHKDSNPWNNELSNLEWCTHKENMLHAIAHGAFTSTKPTLSLVKSVLILNDNNVPLSIIRKVTGFSMKNIKSVLKRYELKYNETHINISKAA